MAEKAKTLLRKVRFLELLSRRGDLSGLQFRVAVMLVSLCGTARGYSHPSLDMIARNVGATERGVRKAVDELEARNLFAVSRGRGAGNANRYSPRYDLLPDGHIYDLEKKKGNASSGIDAPSDAPSEDQKKGNGCSETGTGVHKKGNGRSEKTGTDGAATRTGQRMR